MRNLGCHRSAGDPGCDRQGGILVRRLLQRGCNFGGPEIRGLDARQDTPGLDRALCDRDPADCARRSGRGAGGRASIRRARLRHLPRGARRQLGQILRGHAALPAQSQGACRCARAATTVLGDQARHQDDRHAGFWNSSRCRTAKSGRSPPSSRNCRTCRKPTSRLGARNRTLLPSSDLDRAEVIAGIVSYDVWALLLGLRLQWWPCWCLHLALTVEHPHLAGRRMTP